ncbi:MAG: signal peptidase I [Bacteroidales bacterium]|nr:signal peptidase I [Bacteroidales bacterium]
MYTAKTLLKIYVFISFKVPTESMAPIVNPGNRVMVNRLAYGRRIFATSLDSIKHGDITRNSGYSQPKRNDIMVFNNPYCWGWHLLHFDKLQYFVKRCMALPGDTFEIKKGHYHVRGFDGDLGNVEAQDLVEYLTKDSATIADNNVPFGAFPLREEIPWNIREFGPLYMPKAGDTLQLNEFTWLIYGHIIEWEIGKTIEPRDGKFYVDGDVEITQHIMDQGLYFMCGDNCINSIDSRAWGLVPEEFIVGRVEWVY